MAQKMKWAVNLLGAGCSIFILFAVYTMYFNDLTSLSIYLTFILATVFLSLAQKDMAAGRKAICLFDFICVILSMIIGLYGAINANSILERAGSPEIHEVILGIIAIVLVLEATRRFVGLALVILALCLLFYTIFGRHFPSLFIHPGFSPDRISAQMYFSLNGIFGLPMKVMFKYVALFIIFGSLLEMAGGINFFLNLAMAVTGRFSGGLAKIAVISSAFMGSISGSAVANVATTGSLTIPSMIKKGYDPKVAASVEAFASTGGQLLPPVMGATAFLMADFLNKSYAEICIAALWPAILYFSIAFLNIHFYALKHNIHGEKKEDLPKVREVLKKQGVLLLPIIVIILVLAIGYSPIKAVYFAIVTLILASYLTDRKENRITPKKFFQALTAAGNRGVMIGIASACAGIVLGTFLLTGIGAKISSILISLSGGNLLVLLLLSMVASIIFGMGVTTTVCYIILATLVAPSIIQMGVEPILAHLFIFYFGMLSMITPPVAMAVYAASAIANSDPNKTGFYTWKMAIPIFFIPYFFVYSPGMALIGKPLSILWTLCTSLVGVSAISSGLVGYLKGPLKIPYRILMILGGFMLFHGDTMTDAIGFLLLIGTVFLSSRRVGMHAQI
ncbi:MAG: TRAP transporter fused permease subunit [Pseudomonadota bacterium]